MLFRLDILSQNTNALPEIQADQADLARQYSPVDKKIQTGVI